MESNTGKRLLYMDGNGHLITISNDLIRVFQPYQICVMAAAVHVFIVHALDRIYVIESPHDSSSGVFSDEHNPNAPEHHSAESGDSTNTAEHERPPQFKSHNDDIYPPPPPYTGRTSLVSKCGTGSCETSEDNQLGHIVTDNCTSPEDSAVSVSDSNSYECGIYNVRLSELIVEHISDDSGSERHQTATDGRDLSDVNTTQRSQITCVSGQRPSLTRRCETPIESNCVLGPFGVPVNQMRVAGQCRSERWSTERCSTPHEEARMQGSCPPLDGRDEHVVSRQCCHTPDVSRPTAPNFVIQRGKTFVVSQPAVTPGDENSHHGATPGGFPGTDRCDAAELRTQANCGSQCLQTPGCNEGTYVIRGRRGTEGRPGRGDAYRRRVQRHRSPSTSSSSCDSSSSSAVGCVPRRPPPGWSRNGGVSATRNTRINPARKANGTQWSRDTDVTQRTYEPLPRTSRWRQRCESPREPRIIGYRNAPPGEQSPHDNRPPFSRLPDSAISCILSHLPSDQLCRCARVCRRWWCLAWNPALWRCIRIEGTTDASINVDKALKALTRRLSFDTPTVCVMVESIRLSGSVHLTDKGLYTIARRCPELRSLDIHGCAVVTNIALFEVVSRCVNLEQLNVAGECRS